MLAIRAIGRPSVLRPIYHQILKATPRYGRCVRSFSGAKDSLEKIQDLCKRELTPAQIKNNIKPLEFKNKSIILHWDHHQDAAMIKLRQSFIVGASKGDFAFFPEGVTESNRGLFDRSAYIYPLEDTETCLLSSNAIGFCYLNIGMTKEAEPNRIKFILDLRANARIQKIWERHKNQCFANYPNDIKEIELFSGLHAKPLYENLKSLKTYKFYEPWQNLFKCATQDLLTECPFPSRVTNAVAGILSKPFDESAESIFVNDFIIKYRSEISARIFLQTLPSIPPHLAIAVSYGSAHKISFLRGLISQHA